MKEASNSTSSCRYQEAAPFGANTGGVSPAFLTTVPTVAYDGWLTVGITEGDADGALVRRVCFSLLSCITAAELNEACMSAGLRWYRLEHMD